ncbi:F-box/kelch-repeat protein [Prunus yedoensis var. nudiflora]|uniref:F-box/kelch-repeat protein n=1 Tax=Prunus yedoensis var. nudiflora TaxID=2094558 RepID=A0A314Z6I3_PRUYE|nr:F-box/kelch-repeat protein [Prunus yedoensis var. nudiflora]
MDNIQDITQGIQEMKFEVIARSLPEEIIQHILIRLPVKSLIKCTSVCKTWRSMIINQSFIRAHLSTTVDFANQNDVDLLLLHRISGSSSRNNYQNTFIHKVEDEVHSVHHDKQAFDEYSEIEFPIAAKKNYGNSHIPIKKSVTLPKPGITFPTQGVKDGASIGFDGTPTLAEVYSLATGTWRSLGCVSPACLIDKAASTAFVNGVLHWPVVCQTDVDSYYFILTFDLGKEVFSQIPMPKIIQWNFKLGLQLSVSDNRKSIALFMMPNNLFMDYGREDSVLDIWVMKEYGREESWTKLITLNPQGPETIFLSALCFRKSGEVLLLLKEKEKQELVSLDLVSKQFKLLRISGYKYCTGHFYKESLLLLDNSDAESY